MEGIILVDADCIIDYFFPFDSQSAYQAGKIYTLLKKEGKLIGNQDILIASIALTNDIPLLTRNIDHFQRIKGIKIISPRK